jgi:hypothetical protein
VSSTDGFFIDEESDDDENSKLVPTFLPSTGVGSEVEAKPVEEPGDLRTGIVFEAGTKHFDRHNRMHKERPVRVTSVMDALQKSDIREKYVLLDDDVQDSSPEQEFLEDDDYLQVHLPGYMKRYDSTIVASGFSPPPRVLPRHLRDLTFSCIFFPSREYPDWIDWQIATAVIS